MKNCITDINGILVGQASDTENMTGCTVILCPDGATCGLEVRGGGPGTRECSLLNPIMTNEKVNAVFISGGSSYGLSVGDGIMRYLEEKEIGFESEFGRIPIVPGAVLFDLSIGNSNFRPNSDMGYIACKNAKSEKIKEGNEGAGTGATVGKVLGFEHCMKGGIGSASIHLNSGVTVGAIIAVNSFGDIRDPRTKQILAGPLMGDTIVDTIDTMLQQENTIYSYNMDNTALAVVATNAKLTKSECTRMAQMATSGLYNTIYPYATSLDGDTVFALSCGDLLCDINLLGVMASQAISKATVNAIKNADSYGEIKACKDLIQK